MSIKRYSVTLCEESNTYDLHEERNGEYMLFDDHKAIYKTGCDMIAELEATIATLTADRDQLRKELAEAKAVVEKNASNAFTLEERRIVCMMEHDIHKYGELQCDYNGWMRDLAERREVALAWAEAKKASQS